MSQDDLNKKRKLSTTGRPPTLTIDGQMVNFRQQDLVILQQLVYSTKAVQENPVGDWPRDDNV